MAMMKPSVIEPGSRLGRAKAKSPCTPIRIVCHRLKTIRIQLIYTGDDLNTMAMVNKWAISGELPLAFGFSNQGESFVYRELYTGPS